MNRRTLLFVLFAAGCLLAPLHAQPAPEDHPTGTLTPETTLTPRSPSALFSRDEKASGSSSSNLVTYFVALAALAAGGFYFMKRGLPLRGGKTGENHLHLLETKMLGNRQFLIVVQYEDSKMLVGVGPGQIQYLCPLESADADLERLMAKGQPAPDGGHVS